jgi:hypothetical protein
MALVKKLVESKLDRDSHHEEVECTYCIIYYNEGSKCLQIDTYGSKHRLMEGKKSQTIRFTPEALGQLKSIISQF